MLKMRINQSNQSNMVKEKNCFLKKIFKVTSI